MLVFASSAKVHYDETCIFIGYAYNSGSETLDFPAFSFEWENKSKSATSKMYESHP